MSKTCGECGNELVEKQNPITRARWTPTKYCDIKCRNIAARRKSLGLGYRDFNKGGSGGRTLKNVIDTTAKRLGSGQ